MTRADAARVGRTLTQLLEEPLTFDDHTVRVGASVGIAVFPDDAADAESLQIAADLRMYAGKNASKESGGEEPPKPFPVKAATATKHLPGLQAAE
jgi:predicted signal transduction protein with EAL and GGDEF domain